METLKVYEYKTCSTCKKALKWLDAQKIAYTIYPIVESPPSKNELSQMLKNIKDSGGTFKNLLNTSGVHYREMGLAEKIKNGMTEAEVLELLSKNGKLIKRPFVLGAKAGAVGFKAEIWEELFL